MRINSVMLFYLMHAPALFSQNLVPNPSFEDTIACPVGIGQMYASDWYSPTGGTPDYFNSCSTTQMDIPDNFFGKEQAKEGIAYVGGSSAINHKGREYIQARLKDTLVFGKRYYVSFYVSLADSSEYACNNMGAFFSVNPVSTSGNWVLPYAPQIANDTFVNPLIGKSGWTLVADTFTAQGGELYITIGNFNDTSTSNIIFMGGSLKNQAYYYIDDVSVYTNDSLNTLGVNENDLVTKISIFPNPSSGIINVKVLDAALRINAVDIFNVFGKRIYYSNENKDFSKINIGNVDNGVYFLQLKGDIGSITRKIIIQK